MRDFSVGLAVDGELCFADPVCVSSRYGVVCRVTLVLGYKIKLDDEDSGLEQRDEESGDALR